MRMIRRVIPVLVAIALPAIAGCALTPFSPVALKADEAVVYVYRTGHSFAGSAVKPSVRVDGEKIGRLKNNGYVYKVIKPGMHQVSCATETKSIVPFEAQASKSYYIEGEIQIGFFIGRPKLVMVPEETGKLAILGTNCYNRKQ